MSSANEKHDQCRHCKRYLPLINFIKDKSGREGFGYHCKECHKIKSAKYYQKRKDDSEYRTVAKKSRDKYNSSPKGKQTIADYCKKHKEERLLISRKWRKDNKERSNKLANKSYHKRMLNPNNRIIKRIRSLLRLALKSKDLCKTNKTFDLLGYSKQDLVNHIEQFVNKNCIACNQVKVILENSHIDHIKPISLASSLEEIIELNQLRNLRLICATCNHKKWSHYHAA